MPFPIEKILASAPLVKKDGRGYVMAEDCDATAFIALGQEVLQVPRIVRAEVGSEVVFVTHKGERYYFAAEQVVGFRFGNVEARAKHGGAGFGK